MAIIIIECIGFCATHSICDMLRMDGRNRVSHGSKNFVKGTPLGVENLSFPQFYRQMNAQHEKYANCIAVHSHYAAEEIAKTIDGSTTTFIGLMRRSQRAQILSSFYWAVKKFLHGDEQLTRQFGALQSQSSDLLAKLGLPCNMTTCFMVWAFNHVVVSNLALSLHAQKICFMEDVIADPGAFVTAIGADWDVDAPLIVEQGPSHKDKVQDFDFLRPAEGNLDQLLADVSITVDGRALGFGDIEDLLHKRAE